MSAPISLLSNTSPTKPTSNLGHDQLNMQDFLQLMTQQLENQDPLDPMSDSDFFAQMAQLGTVEGMDQLNNSSQVQQAQSLMGQTVTAANPNPSSTGTATITGVVNSLSIQNGVYYLGVQTSSGVVPVPISSLQLVQQTPNLGSASSLIGTTVSGNGGGSSNVSGTVTGITVAGGVPSLTVQESGGTTGTLGIDQIGSISN